MRGYFAVGVEGLSKSGNLGALMRTAHAFGASFLFTIGSGLNYRELRATDTSGSFGHLPYFAFNDAAQMQLPHDCTLVGVELTPDAVFLPSFHHPAKAAYLLGPEDGSLSPALVARCNYVVKIPTAFCINVGLAGALVMYDRMVSLGNFAERPVRVGGVIQPLKGKRDAGGRR